MEKSTKLNTILNLVAAALMLFFSIPKLIGVEKSRVGFEQFKSLVPLDADVFRIFTGSVELLIAILLIIYAVNNKASFGKIAYFFLMSTMVGAIIMEFFARSEPDIMLTIIAFVLFGLSFYRLKLLLKK